MILMMGSDPHPVLDLKKYKVLYFKTSVLWQM